MKLGAHRFIGTGSGWLCRFQIVMSLLCLCLLRPVSGQSPGKTVLSSSLPKEYGNLRNDTDRMLFLKKAIADSLDEGQLSLVLDWARIGLSMAEKHHVDTLRGIFYFDIGKAFTYKYNQYDSAILYYKMAIPYFPEPLNKYHIIALREIMDRYADLGNKDSSFAFMDRLKSLTDTLPDSNPRKISLAQNIAVVYQGFGMYRTAIRYYQIAIRGNRQINNNRGLGLALANLGELYSLMDDLPKAIISSKEALHCLADVNMPYMQTAANIADFYISLQQYDSALLYLHLSDAMVEKINNDEARLSNQAVLARIYTAKGQYELAKKILDRTITALSATDNSWTLCRALLNYSDLNSSLGQYQPAITHLQQVLAISGQNNFLAFTSQALEKLAAIYARTGDYQPAFRYLKQFMNLRDSMATSRTKNDLNDLEVSYKTLQNEQEIALLKKDNDIKNFQIRDAKRARIFYLFLVLFLLGVFALVLYQRSRRVKIQAQKIRAELQMQILRSQMNPHFIFNSLNSIENFIMQNEKRLASDYLNKFSKLIRTILDSSRDTLIPLMKDMEVLQLYTDLEQLRFNNKFRVTLYTDPRLSEGDYVVPSLIIQPYVENAIVHGIAHSRDEQLELKVSAVLDGDNIKYTIEDNGVGREKAAEYNRQNKPGHKSVGLQITAERISNFNHDSKSNPVQVIDLYNANHEPCGTRVEIHLKAV